MNSSVVSKLKQELEQKNRELAIQASLEKVRTVAMAMKKAEDMLAVCRMISKELERLGINEIRNLQTAIVYEEKSMYLNYEYFRLINETSITSIPYKQHPATNRFVRKMLNDPEGFFTTSFKTREQIKEWIKYQSKSGQFVDPHLKKATSLHYYFYSIGPGALGISTYAPLNKEEMVLFKRFRNVFKLSFQRFIDIQKAEANSREAEIQLSLERVRARALAMHKSEELTETSSVLFHELNRLGIHPRRSGFGIYDKELNAIRVWLTTKSEGVIETAVLGSIPVDAHPVVRANFNAWKRKKSHMFHELAGTDVRDYYQKIGSYMSMAPQKKYPPRLIFNVYFFSDGSLNIIADKPLSVEQNAILDRFASVFDLTYRRFLDLQKAESQTRQAQIELAVERVRAKALAMHKSEELHGVVTALKKELIGLDIPNVIAATMYLEQDDGSIRMVDLTTGGAENPEDHLKLDKVFRLESTDPKLWVRRMFNNTKKYFVEETDHDDFNIVVRWLESVDPVEARKAKKILREKKIKKVWLPTVKLEKGRMNIDLLQPPTPEIEQIMVKLGAGFDLAYRRFLDLQKAEAQTRKSQIELGLERVRARAMAMHKSEEVMDVAGTLFEELQKLNFSFGASSIIIMDKESGDAEYWIAGFSKNKFPESYPVKYFRHPYHDTLLSAWKKGEKYLVYNLQGKEKKTYDEVLFSKTGYRNIPENEKQLMRGIPSVTFSIAFMKHGALHWGPSALDGDHPNVLQRFAQVFEQAYTRFLDLQKAESQAKESQIEASLERVRAKAMSMHSSEELASAITTFYHEIEALTVTPIRCGVAMTDKDTKIAELSTMNTTEAGESIVVMGRIKMEGHPILDQVFEHWLQQKEYHATLRGNEIKEYYKVLRPQIDFPDYPHDEVQYGYYFMFKEGDVYAWTENPLTEEQLKIYRRFTTVLSLTFKRYNDLKYAEAQALEAKVEASLERVRTIAMGMKQPADMLDVCRIIADQLQILNISDIRNVQTIIIYESKFEYINYQYFVPYNKNSIEQIDYRLHPVELELAEKMLTSKEAFYFKQFEGEELQRWRDHRRATKQLEDPLLDKVETAYYYFYSIGTGALGITTYSPLNDGALIIFKRFRNVFELAYKRYIDIEFAEAQAREAKIETALERVRARALAMQTPEELSDVAQVLRNEMGALGIEELETASIYIHEKDSDTAECWYALKDPSNESKKMVADQFIVHLDETWVGREMKKFYLSGEKQTSIVMKGEKRKEWIEYCYNHSPVFRGYYGENIPDRTYHLYKFSHGYVGAAAPGDLTPESWKLLSRAASVFSLAYSRFKDLAQARIDLQRLKEEKQRAESALAVLKSTQTQLIQSEKMASLGELTAGIAHEIQNPLNFVNNFSEVSNELITEMLEQLEKGNKESAIDLVEDVKQNLEKINQHGKRADSIVKSMLQHSRSSTGQKELTDINALVDEYLRLAFHGFRAKDQSFNSKFETQLDESLEKINLVPQEIGRVILNLINNAFYAVTEKRKENIPGYEPMVTVSTLNNKGMIEIRVQDNGNGMPSHVTEKIFQPFFTTKPTGQGTGLGLSLSYDIVTKGHGGELKVNTREGEGSEFVVQLPA